MSVHLRSAAQLDRFAAVARFDRVQPYLPEHLEHEHAHDGIVVRNQDYAALG